MGQCGHEWEALPSNRVKGNGCPYCAGRLVLTGFNDLSTVDPELAAQWHPTKNGKITPVQVYSGSHSKVWWRCSEGHEWQAAPRARLHNGTGCPVCAGKQIVIGFNDLAAINPELVEEWHPTKNGDFTPQKVTAGNNTKKVWWLGKCGHEWQATISSRSSRGLGCPICANRTVLPGYNDLATTHPLLAAEWHPTKNGNLTPRMVISGTPKKVWWKCSQGHEWKAQLSNRASGTGCPHCSGELKTSFPEQTIFYYFKHLSPAFNRYQHNGKTEIDVYMPEFRFGVEYDGPFHQTEEAQERDARKNAVLAEAGIMLVRVKEVDNLIGYTDSDTIIYCKPNSSNLYMNEVVRKLVVRLNAKSRQSFIVDVDVERDRWDIYAQYISMIKENSLAEKFPDIAAEWHPSKNGVLTPHKVFAGSHTKVWWKCSTCDHEWETKINTRTRGSGCPICGKKIQIKGKIQTQIASVGSLADNYPELAAEWHPTKNGSLLPSEVTPFSGNKAWWICEKGHEWESLVSRRSSGAGCPYCSGRRAIPGETDLATTNPRLAAEWHPSKNEGISPSSVKANSGKDAWWLCSTCGHEWKARIVRRNHGAGCPQCKKE